MKHIKYILIVIISLLSFSTPLFAQETLKVSTIVEEPFVINKDNQLTGFSIELWKSVANYLERPYEFYVQDDLSKMLNSVKRNEVDAGISNITINTERQEILDFSDPYFDGGLQIIVSRKNELNTVLKSIQSKESQIMLIVFLLLLLVISHLEWFLERRKNERISNRYFPGIFQCMWCVLTLGEFGNNMPKTIITKVTFVIWFMSLGFMFTLYGAGISSDLTINRSINSINSYHDLNNKRVGALSGSIAESFLRKQRITYIPYANLNKMFKDIGDNTLEAVVHDYPVINNYVYNEGAGKVKLAGKIFEKEKYGIILPKESPLTEEVNEALLFLQENGTYNKLLNKWFSNL